MGRSSLPPYSQGNGNGAEMRGAVVRRKTARLTGTVWGTTKRADTLAADAHVTHEPGGVAKTSSGAGLGVCGGGGARPTVWGAPGGKIPRARLYPNSTTL